MKIDHTTCLLALGALLAGGCARPDFDPDSIGVDIEIASAETSTNPPSYRASAKGDAARTGIEYFAAFGAAADRQCAGAPTRYLTTIDDLDAPIRDGAPLSMEFGCVEVALPNHAQLPTAQFDARFSEPVPGLHRKQRWASTAGAPRAVREFNELVGGFVLEAYTGQCDGGPMLIERVATATEEVNTTVAHARKPRVHVTVDYRCVSADAHPPPAQPHQPLPASAT